MRPLALCALLLASGCASQPDTDLAGNVYPVQCRDMSDVHPIVVEVTPEFLAHNTPNGYRRLGMWMAAGPGQPGLVFIDKTLAGWKRVDVLKHETCHAAMFVRTGSPVWHP